MIESTKSSVTKPDTSDAKRIATSNITVADLVSATQEYNPDDTVPYVQFIEDTTGREFSLRSDISAYQLVKTGGSSKHPYLSKGYVASTRFNFLMLYEVKTINGKNVKVLTGVHAYPSRDFIASDMSDLLKQPVAEDEAIVQLLPEGNLIMYTFPRDLYTRGAKQFINALEAVTELNVGDTLKTPTATCTLNAIVGSLLHFSVFKNKD